MGPPTGWYRLRLLRQIGDELVPGVEQFLLVDDVVAVEDGAALVPGQEHGDALGDVRTDQVAGGRCAGNRVLAPFAVDRSAAPLQSWGTRGVSPAGTLEP